MWVVCDNGELQWVLQTAKKKSWRIIMLSEFRFFWVGVQVGHWKLLLAQRCYQIFILVDLRLLWHGKIKRFYWLELIADVDSLSIPHITLLVLDRWCSYGNIRTSRKLFLFLHLYTLYIYPFAFSYSPSPNKTVNLILFLVSLSYEEYFL